MKLAHVWSSDQGAVLSLPYMRPFLARGWQVFVICPEGPRLGPVREAGVTWLPFSLKRRFDPVGDVRGAAEVVRYCRTHRFDIVHTHNPKAGLVGRVAAAAGRAPRILHTVHGMIFGQDTPLPRRTAIAGLEWLACRFVDRMLVQSREDEATLLRSRVVERRKIVRISNGIDLSRFDPDKVPRAPARALLGLGEEDVLFLSAGRLVREKGYIELIEATKRARARNPRIQVAIAGPIDSDKGDVLSPAELDDARTAGIRLLGERDDMPALIAAADVIVLPSWREGLPRFLIEGAAMAKPLVATDVRGCREVLQAPHGGELVPVQAPERLAEAMLALAADPDRRGRAGAYNRSRARAEYDIERVIERITAVYDELLAR